MKRFVSYLLWTIGILVVAFAGVEIGERLKGYSEETHKIRPLVVYSALSPVFLGLITRLPQFISEWKNAWKMDWVKLGVIGLPMFIIMISPVVLYFNLVQLPPFQSNLPIKSPHLLSILSGFVFGYVILNSLKENQNPLNVPQKHSILYELQRISLKYS